MLHQRAEEALESIAPLESEVGLSHFLKCMLHAHERFDTECDCASALAGLEPRSKKLIAALNSDLQIQNDTVVTLQSDDDQFSLGVGYVFEGSALGANIIMKRLASVDQDIPSYLTLLTSTAKSRWPNYIKTLEQCKNEKCVLEGAVMAFEYIITQAELVS